MDRAPSSDSDVPLLQGMAIFGGISVTTLRYLTSLRPAVLRSAGDYFFHEGEPGDALFVLTAGRVLVFGTRQGKHYRLREIAAGDCFGELSLVDLGPRAGTALALEDCAALQFTQGDFYEIFKRDAEQFALIQMNMGREIARKLRGAMDQLFEAQLQCHLAAAEVVLKRN